MATPSDAIFSESENFFSIFFVAFSKFRFNIEHFKKDIILIADVFLNLQPPKNVVR